LKVLKRTPQPCSYLCLTKVKYIKNVNIEKKPRRNIDNVLIPLSSIMGQFTIKDSKLIRLLYRIKTAEHTFSMLYLCVCKTETTLQGIRPLQKNQHVILKDNESMEHNLRVGKNNQLLLIRLNEYV